MNHPFNPDYFIMFQFPTPTRRKSWIVTLASLASLSGVSSAQDFTMMVANPNPLGLGSFVPIGEDFALGIKGSFKGDYSYGLGIQSVYNSNFFETSSDEESELTTYFSPWIHYTSDPEGGAVVTLTANYLPSYRAYLENSDLNGLDQSGDLTLSFVGSRTKFDVFGRYAQVSGTDRLTGEFVEGSVATGGLRLDRQLAARTTLNASFTAAESDYGSSDSEGSEVYTTMVGGFWAATERMSIGPSLRYTASKSDNIGTREAWSLMLAVNYRVGERIHLAAAVGPEYSTYSGGSGDGESGLSASGDLNASYVINERWSWTGSINSAVVPSPDQEDFVINNVAISTSLDRKLVRGSISGGIDYNLSSFEDVTTGDTSGSDENNIAVFVRYNRPLFSERLDFNSEIRYTFNDRDDDWSQVQVAVGLSVTF